MSKTKIVRKIPYMRVNPLVNCIDIINIISFRWRTCIIKKIIIIIIIDIAIVVSNIIENVVNTRKVIIVVIRGIINISVVRGVRKFIITFIQIVVIIIIIVIYCYCC